MAPDNENMVAQPAEDTATQSAGDMPSRRPFGGMFWGAIACKILFMAIYFAGAPATTQGVNGARVGLLCIAVVGLILGFICAERIRKSKFSVGQWIAIFFGFLTLGWFLFPNLPNALIIVYSLYRLISGIVKKEFKSKA